MIVSTINKKLLALEQQMLRHLNHKILYTENCIDQKREGTIERITRDDKLNTIWLWINFGEKFPLRLDLLQIRQCLTCDKPKEV